MSTNHIKILYRKLIKSNKGNLDKTFKEICHDTDSINKFNNANKQINYNISNLLSEYETMKSYIKEENVLLESYNINIIRDNKDKLRKTASYVGLRMTDDKN